MRSSDPSATPDFSLVLACYNEAEHFTTSMRDIFAVLDEVRWRSEIIFVDDGSRDRTRALIDELIAAGRLLPDGRVMTYGSDLAGLQTGHANYDIWDSNVAPDQGHLTLPNNTGTDIFCSSRMMGWKTSVS